MRSPGQSFDQSSDTWRFLARVAALCNRATFKPDQEEVPIPKVQVYCCNKVLSLLFTIFHESIASHLHLQRLVVGDASETALLKFTELTIGNIPDYRNRFKKVVEVPFNSTNKFQVTTGDFEDLVCIHSQRRSSHLWQRGRENVQFNTITLYLSSAVYP